MDPREWSAVRILCEAQGVDMHLFLFAGSQKSARGFSKFEIAAAGPSHCEAAKKCSALPLRVVTAGCAVDLVTKHE